MRYVLVVVSFLVGLSFSQAFTEYNDYKVYHLNLNTKEHIAFVKDLEQHSEVDFWTQFRRLYKSVDLMISPTFQAEFEELLEQKGIPFTIKIKNVEEFISKERIRQSQAITKQARDGKRFDASERYYRHNEINEYLEALADEYPELVTLEVPGTSLEGREIIFAKVSTNPANTSRPIVLIDGGVHSREWISAATPLYILQQLVENEDYRDLIENVDWYILPVLNPDGYEFSHTTTRLWKKTRSQGAICFGVDANRNFDYFWGTVGSSASECSEQYRGPVARSEIETRVFESFLRRYAQRIRTYITFHSYGEVIVYPWGYIEEAAENEVELQELGEAIGAAINVYNSSIDYTTGVYSLIENPTSGDTIDWVYGALDVNLTYSIDLPDFDNGFLVPAELIEPISKAVLAGLRALASYLEP